MPSIKKTTEKVSKKKTEKTVKPEAKVKTVKVAKTVKAEAKVKAVKVAKTVKAEAKVKTVKAEAKVKTVKAEAKVKTVKAVKTEAKVKTEVGRPKTEVKKKVVKKVKKAEPDLKSTIIEGILEKKGDNIAVFDFSKIHNTMWDFFIICTGNSSTHVDTIADSIIETVRKKMGIKPSHKEGFENSLWILLDYFNIVVHIFQPETRNFYQLDALWADAEVSNVK